MAKSTYSQRPGPTTTIESDKKASEELPFGPKNYKLLVLGIIVVIAGYLLLSVEKFKDASEGFSVALHVAPVVILAGYAEIIYAIMAPKHNSK
ncbi:MAG: DUF3098 domain-containing protein [Bacteroidia bacterium]|nr:DUF3098 domain-containing protein [Bacteroidia bacterium]